MRLTDNEMDIMRVLWRKQIPLTAAEIVDIAKDRSERAWKDRSIFVLMNSLIKKKAVVYGDYKHTATNIARSYAVAISLENYVLLGFKAGLEGMKIDKELLIKGIEKIVEESLENAEED
jgi:BlaI family penicillinase repressor